MTRVDSPVPLMHHDADRSWINDPDPDHPKGTLPETTDELVAFSNSGVLFTHESSSLYNPPNYFIARTRLA